MAEYSLAELSRSGIYQIVNTVNGKRYIGSAKVFRIRWNAHRTGLTNNKHHSRHLQASWIKHGAEAFAFEIIEFCEADRLLEREQFWLDGAKPEFNVCPTAGNTLGRRFTEEVKEKIRAKAIGRKVPPRSAEYRAKISAIHKGRKRSAEHMAALQAGRAKRVYTEEQRSALSLALKLAYANGARAREKSESHRRKIGQHYAKLSDDQVRQIRAQRHLGVTCKELAEMYGSNAGTICEIANGKRYRWVE